MVSFQVAIRQDDGSFRLVGDPTPDMREMVGVCNRCGKEVYVRSGPQRTYWAHRANETCEPKPGFVPFTVTTDESHRNKGAVKAEDSTLEAEFAAAVASDEPASGVDEEPLQEPFDREEYLRNCESRREEKERRKEQERIERERKKEERREFERIEQAEREAKAARRREMAEENKRLMADSDVSTKMLVEIAKMRFENESAFSVKLTPVSPMPKYELPWLTLWALSKEYRFFIPDEDWQGPTCECEVELVLKRDYTAADYQRERDVLLPTLDSVAIREMPTYDSLCRFAATGRPLRIAQAKSDIREGARIIRFRRFRKP